MKKGKSIIGALALFVAIGSALAFKVKTLPGNLYYYNSENSCVAAPCSTVDQTGNACQNGPLFSDAFCLFYYGGHAYTTDGGN